MIPRKKPTRSDDLEALIAQARHYASRMMETSGSVPPTLMAFTSEGFMMLVPKSLDGEKAKDAFANAARLLASGYRATAVCMILESWAVFAKRPGQPLPEGPPSQSPNREEVVAITGESRGVQVQQFLFIQRNSQGKFTGFGKSIVPQFDDMDGRFAKLMPPKEASEKDAEMARLLLGAMGMSVTNAGFNPMWN